MGLTGEKRGGVKWGRESGGAKIARHFLYSGFDENVPDSTANVIPLYSGFECAR